MKDLESIWGRALANFRNNGDAIQGRAFDSFRERVARAEEEERAKKEAAQKKSQPKTRFQLPPIVKSLLGISERKKKKDE